jgi:hypothetical protein
MEMRDIVIYHVVCDSTSNLATPLPKCKRVNHPRDTPFDNRAHVTMDHRLCPGSYPCFSRQCGVDSFTNQLGLSLAVHATSSPTLNMARLCFLGSFSFFPEPVFTKHDVRLGVTLHRLRFKASILQ